MTPSGSMTDSFSSLRINGHDYTGDGDDGVRGEENMELLVGSVDGKIAILVDDMIDTGETVRMASESLKENGASQVWVLVGHCKSALAQSRPTLSNERAQVWSWTLPRGRRKVSRAVLRSHVSGCRLMASTDFLGRRLPMPVEHEHDVPM